MWSYWSTVYIIVSVILMLRCNSLPNKTCPISMKLGRNHKDQKPEKICHQTNKQIRQFSKLIFFWFSYWVKSTILSLRNRPSLPLSLNMHGVNQNAFIVSFQKQKIRQIRTALSSGRMTWQRFYPLYRNQDSEIRSWFEVDEAYFRADISA